MKKYLVAITMVTSLSCYSQQPLKWPAITRQSKPWTRWWWQGSAVNKSDLTYAMQQYQKAGLGGMEIRPGDTDAC